VNGGGEVRDHRSGPPPQDGPNVRDHRHH
jgi:hypothetical protein